MDLTPDELTGETTKQLRDQVWATWRSGHGNHSSEHQDAVRMAMAACQERPRPVARSSAA